MNFEPCNPPLMDPLYLTGVTLLNDKPRTIIFLQQDLKITLFPEDMKKTYPVRPFPVRAEVTSSAQSMTSSYVLAPLIRGNIASASSEQTLISQTSPPNCEFQTPSITRFQTKPTSNNVTPNITQSSPLPEGVNNSHAGTFLQPVSSPDPTSFLDEITTTYIRKTPAQFPPTNPRKISPVRTLKKKSPKSRSGSSSPYSSPNTSPDSTPTTSCSRNWYKRYGILESQVAILKIWFCRNNYLSREERSLVSIETGLPEKTVTYWFQNQRTRVKKEYKAYLDFVRREFVK